MINNLLRYLKKNLPKSFFIRLRKIYYFILKKVHLRISEKELREILTDKLGIKKGSVVFIHSAVDKLYLKFPYYDLLPILRDAVGPEGTLLFSCSHILIRAEEYLMKPGAVFDVKRSVTIRGILPEMARMEKDAFRSLHPTNSVVAIGKYAKELTYSHQDTIYPCGEKSPFYEIIKYNGIIVGLGVDVDRLSFVHSVEDVMKEEFPVKTRLDKVFECKVIDYERNVRYINTLVAKEMKYRNVRRFMKNYIPKNICNYFSYKGVSFFRADANKLFEKLVILAREGKTIYFQKAEK
jgi:aminoglycoside 3-N-acetyltransferase